MSIYGAEYLNSYKIFRDDESSIQWELELDWEDELEDIASYKDEKVEDFDEAYMNLIIDQSGDTKFEYIRPSKDEMLKDLLKQYKTPFWHNLVIKWS